MRTPTHSLGVDRGRAVGTSAGATCPQLTAVCALEGATAERVALNLLVGVHLNICKKAWK